MKKSYLKAHKALNGFEAYLKKMTQSLIGYPTNLAYDYRPLLPFFQYSLNNLGDPFHDCGFKIHSRSFEKKVLDFFAKLYQIPKDKFWGYVCSGGTEGNLYGLFLARELYPKGHLIFSQASHYSIHKAARILKLPHTIIPTDEHGEMNYDHLKHIIQSLGHTPLIFNLNIGTTMHGAIDKLDTVVQLMKDLKIKKFYIHCDAALSGMIVPFTNKAHYLSFKQPIHSIAVSGHKFIGSPIPCGVVLTHKYLVEKIANNIDYIKSLDTTITGSRSGLTPMILWYAILTHGLSGFKQQAHQCLEQADYLYQQLKVHQIPCWKEAASNTVLFKPPHPRIADRWQLATSGDWAHVIVMQHVTKPKIDQFMQDIIKSKKV